jgi:soluble lytic murein transglycosylase-like protein
MIGTTLISFLITFTTVQSPLIFKKDLLESRQSNLIRKYIPYSSIGAKIPFKQKESNKFNSISNKIEHKINFTPEELLKTYITKSFPESIQVKGLRVVPFVLKISKTTSLDPLLILSIIWTESDFNDIAQSNKGARGLMQLMPRTKKYLKTKFAKDILKIKNEANSDNYITEANQENIIIGSLYIKYLINKFGSINIALAAYNMGPTWVDEQLRDNQAVGTNNRYVNKINKKYYLIANSL